jgi:hypothetical protein
MSDALGLQVLEGLEIRGGVNVSSEVLSEHIRHAIRQGWPQVKPQPLNTVRVALVGSGPSLLSTLDELRDVMADGAKVVTMNGSYAWCLDHHIIPSMQLVMDARPSNARFLTPALPHCYYILASQCHPACFAAIEGRPHVRIFHAVASDEAVAERALLDEFYGAGHWQPIAGGTTVATRALGLLRTMGFVRFDLFGIDSCWMGDQHHAFPQPENGRDRRLHVTVSPSGHPEIRRTFACAPWHLKQFEDVLQMVRFNGQHFLLNVHGDGLIAYALKANAELEIHASGETA